MENVASGYYQKSPSKKLTKTHVKTKILDKNFSKDTWTVYPSIISFLMNIMVNYKNHLHPYVAPLDHNSLNEAKALNIAHTMLGNFCHGGEDKESHMENMGNNACAPCWLQQHGEITSLSISFPQSNNTTNKPQTNIRVSLWILKITTST
jgi:hypothetical protein